MPPGHLARFVRDTVREALDLPALFVQALRLCRAAGLAKPGHVAVDGAKLRAGASKHKATSCRRATRGRRRQQAGPRPGAEVRAWMERAQAADAAGDAQHGLDRRGGGTPDCPGATRRSGMAGKQRRPRRIRAAEAQTEAGARAGPAACDPGGPGPSSGVQERGNRKEAAATAGPAASSPMPPGKARRNSTDGDSRTVPGGGGFVAGHNGQTAVGAQHQTTTAQRVSTNPAGSDALQPLVDSTTGAPGKAPAEVSAGAGFASEANLHAMDARGVRPCSCPGRPRRGPTAPEAKRVLRTPRVQEVAGTTRRAGRRSRRRLRKQVVEPVFGQVKHARGSRQSLPKGRNKVRGGWAVACTAHNLAKPHRARA